MRNGLLSNDQPAGLTAGTDTQAIRVVKDKLVIEGETTVQVPSRG